MTTFGSARAARPRLGIAIKARLASIRMLAWLGSGVVAVIVLLELWAEQTRYGLRVIADTPTYRQLQSSMALHPFQPPASSFASGHVNLAQCHAGRADACLRLEGP